ncbi:MAG: prepilin-type N-terminal cleavage/methylation domain-containing protein [Ruminococcaceae bacterium]|nr:prepilin-type N-terminal cleavage/methylation domain-containing protein [Oscillospiraceae bacterium]
MKSNKGFSLVELIVVIAIMAIIAGVAIPVYSAYITKAEESNSVQLCADAAYAAELANIEYGTTATVAVTATTATITFADTDDTTTNENLAAAQVQTVANDEKVVASGAVVTITFAKSLSEEGVTKAEEALARLN